MKKIFSAVIMMFAFAIVVAEAGSARAGESGNCAYNGITDFDGKSYDPFAIGSPESSAPSNLGEAGLNNGVTDFKGGSYDTFQVNPAGPITLNKGPVAESPVAHGVREAALNNGVTDFRGRSYDTFEIGM